jgi:hypothetical protein
MFDLNRAGRRRVVYQSHSTYNLYGGKVRVNPGTDCAFTSPVSLDTYRPLAADPMNRWVVKFVREHGVREAVGLQPGVALCANHVVVDEHKDGCELVLPPWAPAIRSLTHVFSGKRVKPSTTADGQTRFRLDGNTAYEVTA